MRDIDRYFDHHVSSFEQLKTNLTLSLVLNGCRMNPERPQKWTSEPSPICDGMHLLEPSQTGDASTLDAASDLIVSTVRMGYGHHRIALAVASWAKSEGRTGQVLDLLATSLDESKAIHRLDRLYSAMSRISADLGGPLEALWGRMMTAGDISSCRMADQMASHLGALMADLPRDVPIISAYPINGHLAVRLGFERVINLIFDNDPQHFLIVPGALNLVQTTSSYEKLRMLGVNENEVAVAGHWVSEELVSNIETDCKARIRRSESGVPTTFCLTVGGAGAQKKFLSQLVEGLKGLLDSGKGKLLINLGDHAHMRAPIEGLLARLGVTFSKVHGFNALKSFCDNHGLTQDDDPDLCPVTLFTFDRHLEAVRATDCLMRVSDVLVTKPSELAFVPVPKLHIRRVGDHEAASARRSAELGDGTLEYREVSEAVRMAHLLAAGPELTVPMNERIIAHKAMGVYDGAKNAVKHALTDSSNGLQSVPQNVHPSNLGTTSEAA